MDIILWKCGGSFYLTRCGRRAVVLESNVILATGQHIWQGRVDGNFVEWTKEGRQLNGIGDGNDSLDLVGAIEPDIES